MSHFKRVGVVVKPGFDEHDHLVHGVLKELRESECAVSGDSVALSFDAALATLEVSLLDLLIIIGGDGTILRAIRELRPECPLLSINRGRLGFLTELSAEEAVATLSFFLKGGGVVEQRALLAVEARRERDLIFSGDALNEAVIAQGSIARLIDLRAEVNGEELTTFRSDGLILSTPTGSTAYSLAAGGPIVHPKLSAMILTPINPQSFSQKPVVLPGVAEVVVEILEKLHESDPAEVSLTLDGQRYVRLCRGDVVHVRSSDYRVSFLRRKEETFLQTLRVKLGWGESA